MRALILLIALMVSVAFGGEAVAQGVGVSLDVETITPQRIVPRGVAATVAPRPVQVFSAKFLCGTINPAAATFPQLGEPLVPGTYLTAINIHNPNFTAVTFRKKAVETKSQREEAKEPGRIGKFVTEELRPDGGIEVDCLDITRELLPPLAGTSFDLANDFIKGFLVIETGDSTPLDVVGVYTLKNVEPKPAGTASP